MSCLIDIHCHLADYADSYDIKTLESSSEIIHVSTALNKREMAMHEEKGIDYWFAGLHPREIKMTHQDIIEFFIAFPYDKVIGIGEIGIDRNYPDLDKQLSLLKIQLDRAWEYELPTLYHLVGHEYSFIKLHKTLKLENMKIIHGFNSSYEVFKELDKLGFYFSLSKRVLYNPKRIQVVKAILESKRFFLESDAPNHAELDEVKRLAKCLEINYNIDMIELKEIQVKNFADLLGETSESTSKK